MPKKKSKKVAKTKEIKGQLGKKKETAREKMIGRLLVTDTMLIFCLTILN